MTETRTSPGILALLNPVLLAGLTGAVVYLCVRVDSLETALEERTTESIETAKSVERTLQLLRVEAVTNERGPRAIAEQIEHWAPQLSKSATTLPIAQDIRERLERAVDAAAALEPETFDIFERAFDKSEDDESRRWLLRAAVRVNADRGKAMCADVVRGVAHTPSPLMRLRAADVLTEADPQVAAVAIKDVLVFESSRGLQQNLPESKRKQYEQYVRTDRFPQFFNFIDRYVRTEHEDVESTLQTLLNGSDHDRMTYQECVKQLGALGSKRAVPRIKQLLERPPFGFADPLFTGHCLQAIADIEGSGAREYLEEMLAQPGHSDIVITKLQTLIKQVQGVSASDER